ncbi:MAG: M28 family peptidase [Cytophagales bacterium]
MLKRLFSVFFITKSLIAQVSDMKTLGYQIIQELSNPDYFGRGYVFEGHTKASTYILNSFQQLGLDSVWVQEFPVDVVCFEKDPILKINNKNLKPGYDFTLSAGQRNWTKSYTRNQLGKSLVLDSAVLNKIPTILAKKTLPPVVYSKSLSNDSLIFIKESSLPQKIRKIEIKIESTLKKNLKTQNVIGLVKGQSDSIIIVCAHYDHLGAYGNACYFPGSLDNASGIALMTCYAKQLLTQTSTLKHSLLFVAFGAEELGLLGSKFFVENSRQSIDLSKVKQVINLDLVGTGKDGITIENANSNSILFQHLEQKNQTQNWFPVIKTKGNRPNSDHYPFSQKGIASYFIYTLGEAKEYHNVYDNINNVTLSKWDELLEMLNYMISKL